MKKAQEIKICQSLPLKSIFENSIIQYWKTERNGKINLELLEKIQIAKLCQEITTQSSSLCLAGYHRRS